MVQHIVPDDYPDIQSAIDAAPLADDVLVRPGLWMLNPVFKWPPNQITVRPNLLLRGEGLAQRDSTIIQMSPPELSASMRKDVITSIGDVDRLTIQDLTIDQKAIPDNQGSSVVYLRGGVNSNIIYRRLRILNGFGAGIATGGTNILMEDNIIEKVWTGITVGGTDGFTLRRNSIKDTIGNAIYPQRYCINGVIEYNYLESAGDVAVDITSNMPNPPHDNIVVRHNEIVRGHVRVTNAANIILYKNKMTYGVFIIDSGQAAPFNVRVEENEILTDKAYGLSFVGARESDAIGNIIRMLPPAATVDKQRGMILAIRGPSTIERNEIYGARDYAMDFRGWRMGSDLDMTIINNILADFGDVGLYDSGLAQNNLRVLRNTIFSEVPTARWGILTDEIANRWSIEGNALKVGALAGDEAIHAPGSTLINNYEYTPISPLSLLTRAALSAATGVGLILLSLKASQSRV